VKRLSFFIIALVAASFSVTAAETGDTTGTPITMPTIQPTDLAQVDALLSQFLSVADQVYSTEEQVNGSVDTIAVVLVAHGLNVPSVVSAPGTPSYVTERNERNNAVMEYAGDPNVISDLKTNLTPEERTELTAAKSNLLSYQTLINSLSGTIVSLAPQITPLIATVPLAIASGASAGGVDTQELLGKVTDSGTKTLELPGKIGGIIGIIERLLGFLGLVL
jgi:hypothetical protein